MASKTSTKLRDVVPERFRGPQSQDFASWLRKFELGVRVAKVTDTEKVDQLLVNLESPCQEIAEDFVSRYKEAEKTKLEDVERRNRQEFDIIFTD